MVSRQKEVEMPLIARSIAKVVFVLYLLLLLYVTLFRASITLWGAPFTKEYLNSISIVAGIQRGNFVPFHSIDYYLISQQEPFAVGIINVFGNVLLFIPFGFLLPFIWSRLRALKKSVGILLLVSAFLEVMQLVLATGWFDVDDILLNVLGGLVGYYLFSLVIRTRYLNSLFN